MSTEVANVPSTSAEGSSSKRRSLFKPSTWKRAAPADDEPETTPPVDAVETGAPLTTIVSPHHPSSPTPAPSPTSGVTTVVDSLGRVVFFTQNLPNFHLSNSSPHPITYNNTKYPTAEHLFQALKFLPHRPDLASKVRRSRHPMDAIRLARSHTDAYYPGWIRDGINVRQMHQVVLIKFTQYGSLGEALLETGEREIVNASPSDVFWGSGESEGGGGRGRNELGKALMAVREVLREIKGGVRYGSGARTM